MKTPLPRRAAALALAAFAAACASPEQRLSDAIRLGKTRRAEALIERGADVNARDKAGALPLLTAEASGQAGVVRLLVARGANVNIKDETGRPPLEWAAVRGDSETARVMIDKGAALDARDSAGVTALIGALTAKNFAVAGLLIEKGAGVNELGVYGLPLLVYAAAAPPSPEQRAVVDLLIAKGAYVDDPRLDVDPYIAQAAYKARLPRLLAVEKMGDDAAKAGDRAEAVKLYAEALKRTPPGADAEARLIGEFAAAAKTLDPAISAEAKDHSARAQAALSSAGDARDLASARAELEAAAAAAPAWPAAYYLMASVDEKLGDFGAAIRSLTLYLAFAPDAADAAEVRARISKLDAARIRTAGR